jgi:hypothetical protein
MSRTHTLFINLQNLRNSGDKGHKIIRLMMACNDIALANHCQSIFSGKRSPISSHVQKGALMYFVRLQCGHLNEAMKIIEEIKNDQSLFGIIQKCSQNAKDAFTKLTNCLKGRPDYKRFQNFVGQIRQNSAFHYNYKMVDKALNDTSSRPEAHTSKITFGDHISLSRFDLADDIVDSIVCRYIWKIPRSANLRQEADRISDFGSDLCKSLLDFSGEFVYRYIKDYAI